MTDSARSQQVESKSAPSAGSSSYFGQSMHDSYASGVAPKSPWPALAALIIGFFMLLVDTTIVSVANPAIKTALDPASTNLDNVVWVTSAYLLGYAVPLLVTGRLGDRFGPKRIYLIGLVIFTLSSLGCGLSDSLGMLIAFRAVQGLGASLMTPQTMAVITRTFPATQRGAAMGLWGATSGVAMLVGPLAGGVLVDGWGWEWIFFVNLPVGVIGFVLALIYVPKLKTHEHRFDVPGILLSAFAMFCIVFALQEGERYDWSPLIWSMIGLGVAVMVIFVWHQGKTKNEPLVPLSLFRDRNFSVSTSAIAIVGFVVTAMTLPLMFFIQMARGLSPTQSALLMVPTAVAAGVLAGPAGKLLDRVDPRLMLVPGLLLTAGALFWDAAIMNADTPIWVFLLPAFMLGVGNAGMWGPLSTTATRNLALEHAGAGSGIYNAMRTIGSAVGSAAIAAFMQSRIEANFAGVPSGDLDFSSGVIPEQAIPGFSNAMAQATLLPAGVMVLGVVVILFMERPKNLLHRQSRVEG